MKDMVLRPFALECGLEAETAFHILDTFFMTDYRRFYHFVKVDQRIKEFYSQVQH